MNKDEAFSLTGAQIMNKVHNYNVVDAVESQNMNSAGRYNIGTGDREIIIPRNSSFSVKMKANIPSALANKISIQFCMYGDRIADVG